MRARNCRINKMWMECGHICFTLEMPSKEILGVDDVGIMMKAWAENRRIDITLDCSMTPKKEEAA